MLSCKLDLCELVARGDLLEQLSGTNFALERSVVDEDEARQMLRPHIVRLRRKLEPEPSRPTYS